MSVFLIVVLYTTARSRRGGRDCIPFWYGIHGSIHITHTKVPPYLQIKPPCKGTKVISHPAKEPNNENVVLGLYLPFQNVYLNRFSLDI
jgi:hypothetical protein